MPRVSRAVGLLFASFVLVATIRSAAAAEPGDAKARYISGQSHYNLNEFAEALQDFKEAYRLHPDPAFLFNIAQCERQLGDFDEAIKFYRSYLRNKPDATNAREVQRKIEELKGLADAKRKSSEGAPHSVIPPATPPPEPAHAPPPAPIAPLTPPPAAVASPPSPPGPNLAPPPEVAATTTTTTSAPGVDLTATPTAPEGAPIYKQWWFWTGAGALVVGAVVVAIVATSGSAAAPSSPLGNKKVF